MLPDAPSLRALLFEAASRAADYLETVPDRRVSPTPEALNNLQELAGPLPEHPQDALSVLRALDATGSPATVATAGGRFFGFVTGGALPVSVAANWLAAAWDQNAGMRVLSPVGAHLEDVVIGWILDLLHLPPGCGGALVTGAQMANFTCLAAARHSVLKQAGWDVEARGLFGAPEITVIVGEEVHATALKALALLGLGRDRVRTVAVDRQGRMRPEAIPAFDGPAIICTQVGNVNTGAADPVREICEVARQKGAWVHVDGAFGLWAAVVPELAHLTSGVEAADSWATDGHKWLNVPHDSGIALVKDSASLFGAMAINAPYLSMSAAREPAQWGPESSRRARATEIWAALESLGRQGLADLVRRTCRHASTFAERLRAAGFEVLNEVVLNQVLVSFGDDAATQRVIDGIQSEGTCWCGGTVWQGRKAMRISVSSWATTDKDVERSVAAMIGIAAQKMESIA